MKTQMLATAPASPPNSEVATALRCATPVELKLAYAAIQGEDEISIDDDAMVAEIEDSSNVWVQAWVYVCMPKPWVVVDHPGQDDESIIAAFSNFGQALLCAGAFEGKADVMKRLENGMLTTEY